MRIAVAQLRCIPGNIEANCNTIIDLIVQAANKQCKWIVLPEMSDTGYDLALVQHCAGQWPGKAFDAVRNSAEQNHIAVICGLSEREGKNIFNSMAVFGPTGILLNRYRKTHLFSANTIPERNIFTPGDRLTTCIIDPVTAGLLICYDLRFPEASRRLVMQGSQILAIAAAWPAVRIIHWQTLAQARAIENQCYVAAANQVGLVGAMQLGGTSLIVDPSGVIIAQAGPIEQTLIIADVDTNHINAVREAIPVFADRRTELY
jgi:omega-amidase